MLSSVVTRNDETPAVVVETMSVDDLVEVLAIENAVFPTPWSRENFRFELCDNPHARNVVVRVDEAIRAYASVHLIAGELRINNIAVHPAARRQGLGAGLLAHLLEQARSAGSKVASLEVRPSNRAARGLYEAHGFRVVGRRRGYYQDTEEDAILMEKDLASRG